MQINIPFSPQVDRYLFPYSQISCQFVKRKERLEQFTKFIYFFVGQSGQIRFILIGKRSLKQSSAEQNRARQGRKILWSSVNTCIKHIFQIIIFHNFVSDVYSTINRVLCVCFQCTSKLLKFKSQCLFHFHYLTSRPSYKICICLGGEI